MFYPYKCQLNNTLLIVIRTLFYQEFQSGLVTWTHPLMSARAARMIKGLRTAGCWVGTDQGLKSLKRMWKVIVHDVKRTANVNGLWRYVSEGLHMCCWSAREERQDQAICVSVLIWVQFLFAWKTQKEEMRGEHCKIYQTWWYEQGLVFTVLSSIRPRQYPVKLGIWLGTK